MRASASRRLLLPSAVCAALVLGPVGTAAAAVDTHPTTAWPVTWDVTDAFTGRFAVVDRQKRDDTFAPLVEAATRIAEGARTGMDASEATAYADALRTANAEVRQRLADAKGGTDRAADPVSDVVATVQSLVDTLLKALTSLDLPGVLSTVTGLLSTVVGVVGGLLGGLPPLPAVP